VQGTPHAGSHQCSPIKPVLLMKSDNAADKNVMITTPYVDLIRAIAVIQSL
jgi:hypothetical protein